MNGKIQITANILLELASAIFITFNECKHQNKAYKTTFHNQYMNPINGDEMQRISMETKNGSYSNQKNKKELTLTTCPWWVPMTAMVFCVLSSIIIPSAVAKSVSDVMFALVSIRQRLPMPTFLGAPQNVSLIWVTLVTCKGESRGVRGGPFLRMENWKTCIQKWTTP